MPKGIRKNKRKYNLTPVYELIFKLSKLFDSECEVCLRKMRGPTPGFAIHHLEYKKGEKTHSDFSTRLQYYKYLIPIILKNKSRFAFLCNACHHSLDGPRGLKRRKKANVLRLFLMYFRTNT